LHDLAHNDQENGVPLLDAVNLGFCNVETDTNLIDGELIGVHLFSLQCVQTVLMYVCKNGSWSHLRRPDCLR